MASAALGALLTVGEPSLGAVLSKSTIAAIVAALIVAGVAAFVAWRPFSGEAALVREMSEMFMRDIQLKDFRAASLYNHALDRERIDIGRAVEDLFKIKPELIDIKDYRITRVDMDDEKGRAKVLMTARLRMLNKDKKTRENEIALYWLKRHPDCPQGASCPSGQCVDEFGKMIHRPKDADEEDDRRTRDGLTGKTGQEALSDEPYACDVAAEKKWYMNVDSTFKPKDYRNNNEQSP